MKIYAVIPAYNEQKYISRLLLDLEGQSAKPDKVIVADASDDDKTRREARKYKRKLDLSIIKGGLPAESRNKGAKLATADAIVFFFDADVSIEKDFIVNGYLTGSKPSLTLRADLRVDRGLVVKFTNVDFETTKELFGKLVNPQSYSAVVLIRRVGRRTEYLLIKGEESQNTENKH